MTCQWACMLESNCQLLAVAQLLIIFNRTQRKGFSSQHLWIIVKGFSSNGCLNIAVKISVKFLGSGRLLQRKTDYIKWLKIYSYCFALLIAYLVQCIDLYYASNLWNNLWLLKYLVLLYRTFGLSSFPMCFSPFMSLVLCR